MKSGETYVIQLPEDEETKRTMKPEDLTRRLLANQVCENCKYFYKPNEDKLFISMCSEKKSSPILPRQGTCDKWELELTPYQKAKERLIAMWRKEDDGNNSTSNESSS